ncbi:ribosome small subunit-dependent GTPase A [Nocardia sp. NBC_00511]|uniref:ribosome small subunit-dependent GTPase A n=1 Tax=Nocardia sp. NBC_00511 TaxID=2903591 RepID=UPI0030E573EA
MSPVDFDLLAPYGWTSAQAADYLPLLGDSLIPARVVRMDRSECDAAAPLPTADYRSRLSAAVVRVALPRSDSDISGLCTGDWVAIDATRTVRALLPRRTAIVRAAVSGHSDSHARSGTQILAANVDTVLVCTAADGDVDLGRIERLLALAWESGAQPVVVLTKADLAQDIPLEAVRAAAPGVTVVTVSAAGGYGMDVLTALLAGTVALIGPSGAGKSTLANALLGEQIFATSSVREGDKRGRHTTVHRELRPLPGGGTLIDTPGLRSIGLADAAEGLTRTFSDVESLSTHCRFTDCSHTSEPSCAVLAAIESGALPQRRLDSYRKLTRENDWLASRNDARARAERQQAWKTITKTQRRIYKDRDNRR